MATNINKNIKEIVDIVLNTLKNILIIAKIDPISKREIKVTVNGDQINTAIPSHYLFVDSGRKAGKMPPIKPIIEFIKKNNIRLPEGMTQKSLAFAIANSIAKKGVKPRPFIEDLQEELEKLIVEYFINILRIK